MDQFYQSLIFTKNTYSALHGIIPLTGPVRSQVEEIIVFPKHDKIEGPYPSDCIHREFPYTLRKFFTRFFCHVHPPWYVLWCLHMYMVEVMNSIIH